MVIDILLAKKVQICKTIFDFHIFARHKFVDLEVLHLDLQHSSLMNFFSVTIHPHLGLHVRRGMYLQQHILRTPKVHQRSEDFSWFSIYVHMLLIVNLDGELQREKKGLFIGLPKRPSSNILLIALLRLCKMDTGQPAQLQSLQILGKTMNLILTFDKAMCTLDFKIVCACRCVCDQYNKYLRLQFGGLHK